MTILKFIAGFLLLPGIVIVGVLIDSCEWFLPVMMLLVALLFSVLLGLAVSGMIGK